MTAGQVRRAALVGVVTLITGAPFRTFAQPQPPTNFIRTHFTAEDGLGGNVIDEITQTTDGFLWVVANGTALARFDGRTFNQFVQQWPVTVGAAPKGGLWIGTRQALVHIPQHDLSQFAFPGLTRFPLPSGKDTEVVRLRIGPHGMLWVGTNHGLFLHDGAQLVALGPRIAIHEIEETPERHLLLTTESGFIELDAGAQNVGAGGSAIVPHPGLADRLGVKEMDIFHALKDRRGNTWYSTAEGLARETEGRIEKLGAWAPHGHAALRTYEDAEGTVWIAKDEGLFRAVPGGLELVAPGLQVRMLFSDRDGNLWVGTNGDGLYRFKRSAVHMFTKDDGLPGDVIQTVMTARDGTVWTGANCGGLSRFDGTRFQTYNERNGLVNTCVFDLVEDGNQDLWVGTWGGGVFRLHDGAFTQFSKSEGMADDRVTSIVAARDGTMWFGTRSGVSSLRDGRIRNLNVGQDVSGVPANRLFEDRSGVLWAGTRQGLRRFVGDHFELFPLTPKSAIIPIADDPDVGFLVFDDVKDQQITRVEKNRADVMAELPGANNMARTMEGDLWFGGTGDGPIYRVPRGVLTRARATDAPLDYESFSSADGLATTEVSFQHGLALTLDGKLLTATPKGLAVFDLRRLPIVSTKTSIYITNVTIGRKTARPTGEIVLPPGTNHLQMDFGAIEVSSPEKIRMQYRLDDVDSEWLDAGPERHAIYSTLSPGTHVLHIRACNRSGIWDRQGVVFSITQQPFFYQRRWFAAAMAGLGVLLVVGVYRLRVRQMARTMSARFDERLSERTRVAREIHDTLLQTVQGTKLVADLALKDPADHARMARTMKQISTWLAQATDEGRAAVKSLRASATETNDLAEALRRAIDECRDVSGSGVALTTHGDAREIHPAVRDEIYRIGFEAIRNACLHSRGDRVEVALEYGHDLTFSVRDNGVGLDADLAEKGKEGHFGLPGMKERAARIGGRFTIASSSGSGTVITLVVPGRLAFRSAQPASSVSAPFKFWRH